MNLLREKNKTGKFFKNIVLVVLIVSISVPPFFILPQKTFAQSVGGLGPSVPTDDLVNNLKEGALDKIAWTLAKLAIQQITRSTVNWINSGFNGNPAFIGDPKSYFSDLADQVAGQFIQGSELGFICSPFQLQIRRALLLSQSYQSQVSCTLSDAINNVQNFQIFTGINNVASPSNINIGGWEDWYDTAARPQGNIYGSYQQAQSLLSAEINTAQGNFGLELDWGNGFLSWRDCSGVPAARRANDLDNSACPIVTPGSVIVDQLNHTLGAGVDTLVTADELNEVISALFTQLLNQVFSSAGGLLGLSGPASGGSSGGSNYLDNLNTTGEAAFNGSREFSINGISSNISTLQEYIRVKNQSIALVDAAITLQNNITNACGANSVEASSASSTITTTLQPIKDNLLNDIAVANGHINDLNQIKVNLNALAPSDTAGFNQLLSQYSDLLNTIRPETIVYEARNERDTQIPNEISPINTAANRTTRQCNQNQNGTGGGGGGSGVGHQR